MADTKKPDETKADPKPATPRGDDTEVELSDEELGKVSGGLAQLRFNSPRPRPITAT